MSLKSIAMVLCCIVMMQGPVWAASTTSASAVPPLAGPARNAIPPLPPAGPATIKQAQGTDWSGPLLGAAVSAGIFLAVLLLINDDADGPFSTSTTE